MSRHEAMFLKAAFTLFLQVSFLIKTQFFIPAPSSAASNRRRQDGRVNQNRIHITILFGFKRKRGRRMWYCIVSQYFSSVNRKLPNHVPIERNQLKKPNHTKSLTMPNYAIYGFLIFSFSFSTKKISILARENKRLLHQSQPFSLTNYKYFICSSSCMPFPTRQMFMDIHELN